MNEHLAELARIVGGLTDRETGAGTPWGLGTQQSDRIEAVADYCALMWPGDLLEIGCYSGGTTRLLAGVAWKHVRRVVAVDPWAEDPTVYERFLENMKEHRELLDIVRLPSQDKKAIERIEARPLCFAFVDGLHTYSGLLSDILAVAHCAGIVAADDVSYECQPEDLRPACWEGARRAKRTLYWHPKCREAYLLPP